MITWELVEVNFINLCIYVLFNYFVLMFLNLPSRLVETVAGNPPPISYTPTQPAPPLWRSKRPITVTSLPKLFNTATQITKVTVSRPEFLCFSFVGDKNSINAGDLFTRVRGGGNWENSICIRVEAGEMCFTSECYKKQFLIHLQRRGNCLKGFGTVQKREDGVSFWRKCNTLLLRVLV